MAASVVAPAAPGLTPARWPTWDPAPASAAVGPVIPAAASSALRAVLTGTPVPFTVRAVYRVAAYLQAADGTLLAVSGPSATRLPCAVRVTSPALLAALGAGQPATVGAGQVALRGARLQITRWFDLAPALGRPSPAALRQTQRALSSAVASLSRGPAGPAVSAGSEALARSLAAHDPVAACAAADTLLGCGPGSTPSGDDVLAGTLVTLRLLAAVHSGAARAWRRVGEPLAAHVLQRAGTRTTPLSAALLRHAARGEPAGEVGDVLRAATGRGELAGPLRRLLAVGHTSGADLAEGVRIGLSCILTRAEVAIP